MFYITLANLKVLSLLTQEVFTEIGRRPEEDISKFATMYMFN